MAIPQAEQWLLKEKYHGEKSEAFFADCKRLALGEPLAYLIGWTPFLDCTIWLDSHPLIPRSETEFWVEQAIDAITRGATPSLGFETPSPHILDLCSGSGCIGVAVAKAIPNARVDFSEIAEDHLPTIRKNLEENSIAADRCELIHTNLFAGLTTTYDYILSNPPYIDARLQRTDESVTAHEPHLALYGGKEGMDVIRDTITQAPKHLNHGGQLWIEHEPEQSPQIHLLATAHNFSCATHKDQYGVERFSILVLQ